MAQNKKAKVAKKTKATKDLRALQKSRPKRYMNPFICFLHEERKKASNGKLLSDWKSAHKELGSKWRALGANKAKFQRKGTVPAFAVFVKECAKRKEILPAWRKAHKGLGAKWRSLSMAEKSKYVTASKKIRDSYEQLMKTYRVKRINLKRESSKRSKNINKKVRKPTKKKTTFPKKSKNAIKKTKAIKKKAKQTSSKRKPIRTNKQKKSQKNVEKAPPKNQKRQYSI